ncbi:hypothetical protein [uncultured Tyzzerella sp.]|uniref:hypothetical protein n=1 Tax=uncultured Tyzzerella sp. TaxID=2321398 RepID=UPI002941F355|nr:hypothetical protein [uncultured Tyzzerella sp.]
MRILKNGIGLMIVTLQQYSVDTDVLTFKFEKPLGFEIENSLVQIIYETDKLDNIKNNNITIEEIDNRIVINWRVKESITLTKGDKKAQIVIKNNDRVYLSKVFIIKVLESLNIDNQIVETNLSYLEYWESRITELSEKVEEFKGLDLNQFVTEKELEIGLDLKADKTAIIGLATKEEIKLKANVSDIYNKTEIDQKLEDIENIDIDLSNYYNKQQIDEKLGNKANLDSVYTKENTYNKTEVDNKIKSISKPSITSGNGISIDNNTISAKVDNKTIGFNKKGELEAKLTTSGNYDGNVNIKQYIIKDVTSGVLYTIEDEGLPITHKVIPSVFVLESSEQRKTTMTDFNLNIENIESENGIKIQNNYTLNIANGETPIINKSEFTNILSLKGGR